MTGQSVNPHTVIVTQGTLFEFTIFLQEKNKQTENARVFSGFEKRGGGGVCHSQAKIFDLKFSIIYKRIKLQHDAQISWAESC